MLLKVVLILNIFEFMLHILFLWTMLQANSNTSQHKQYEVIHNNASVGTIYISSIEKHDSTEYKLYSDVHIDGIVKVRVEESITNTYVYGFLHQASHHRHVHHISDHYNSIWHENDGYHSSEGDWTNSDEMITHSVLQFYFKEPTQANWVYSEQSQKVLALTTLANRKYRLVLPNGNETIFSYGDNGLQTVESNTSWGQVTFRLKQ